MGQKSDVNYARSPTSADYFFRIHSAIDQWGHRRWEVRGSSLLLARLVLLHHHAVDE